MPDIDLPALESAARKASDDWKSDDPNCQRRDWEVARLDTRKGAGDIPAMPGGSVMIRGQNYCGLWCDDAAFIALCSPSTIRAMVAVVIAAKQCMDDYAFSDRPVIQCHIDLASALQPFQDSERKDAGEK